jgi:hypothetical protein
VARRALPWAVPRPPPEGHRVSKLPPPLAPSNYELFESLFAFLLYPLCVFVINYNDLTPCLMCVMLLETPFLFLWVVEMLVRFFCGVRWPRLPSVRLRCCGHGHRHLGAEWFLESWTRPAVTDDRFCLAVDFACKYSFLCSSLLIMSIKFNNWILV